MRLDFPQFFLFPDCHISIFLEFVYTDDTNSQTFMQAGASAKAAGYNCSSDLSYRVVGCAIKRRSQPIVDKWLESEGIGEKTLKERMLGLTSACETKLFMMKGSPVELRGARIVAETVQTKKVANKFAIETYMEEHTLVAVDVVNVEVRHKALETLMKMQGLLKDTVDVPGSRGCRSRI